MVLLGYIISVTKIAVDPTKVEVILRWEKPTIATEILSF